jgi:phosphoglycolate phosphatase-like HAD superfamily hydrolase
MPDECFVFLDFDDTLSDPFVFHTQYVREVGALLAPQYGGDAEQWAKAAIDMLEALEKEYVARFEANPLNGYCDWLNTVRERSARQMFERMAIPVPPDVARIARETQFNALLQCNAAFPGAAEALTELFEAGCRIQIASGQESEYLMAALMGAGLESYTESKFGPDLVDCAKEGPEYYERIFEATGVKAAEVVVVDDSPPAIGWAMQAGAAVIQSKLSRERHFEVVGGVAGVLSDLRDLPMMVHSIFARR